MTKILYISLSAGTLLLAGIGNTYAQFTDDMPPPQITFSRSPRSMAEEALDESRRNPPAPTTDEEPLTAPTPVTAAPSKVEYEEIAAVKPKPQSIYDVMDANHDGTVSKEEYDAFAKARADKIFKDMDSNHDGQISREEFEAYKTRTPAGSQ